MTQQHLKDQANRLDGIDYLRTVALVLVFVQHQLSVLDLEQYNSLLGLRIGQIGVSLFLAVSGVLAAQGSRPPFDWLRARLIRIYPAYWVATAVGFIGAGLSGYKEFGVPQIISQFVGIGLYTHNENLVNAVTWFISLLLTLYVIVYLAKLSRHPNAIVLVLAVVAVLLVCLKVQPLMAAHSLTFLACFLLLSKRKESDRLPTVILGVVLLLASIKFRTMAYPALSLFALSTVLHARPVPRVIMAMSSYSYEFYLCHGICLVACHQFVTSSLALSVGAGIVSSVLAAIGLHHFVEYALKFFQKPKEPTDVQR
jgi:peptidoglycan/LPS O-acetylase OafA/YrhL